MTIKIHELEFITVDQIDEILQYYNTYKQKNHEALEQCEDGGGFMIAVKGANPQIMSKNQCVKKLKWHKNILVTYVDYPGFTSEEEELLYVAMIYVLGDKYVERFDSYSNALMSSPSFLEMWMESQKQ
jgi:hypothetical protein